MEQASPPGRRQPTDFGERRPYGVNTVYLGGVAAVGMRLSGWRSPDDRKAGCSIPAPPAGTWSARARSVSDTVPVPAAIRMDVTNLAAGQRSRTGLHDQPGVPAWTPVTINLDADDRTACIFTLDEPVNGHAEEAMPPDPQS